MTEQNILPRFGHTTVKQRNKVYFFGGSTTSGILITEEQAFVEYNISTCTWRCYGTEQAPIRKFHAATSSYDGMYIHGGIFQKETLSDLCFYSFHTNEWNMIQYHNLSPPPLYGHTMNLWDNLIYIFGGYSDVEGKFYYTKELYLFDIRS